MDTAAYLTEINRVADSLRDAGDYKACVQYAKKGLELYPEPKPFDYSGYDLSDTVYAFDYNLPRELFSRTNNYYDMTKNRPRHFLAIDTVYNRMDSSLFSGLIISCNQNQNSHGDYGVSESLYANGKFITLRSFWIYSIDSGQASTLPFAKCVTHDKRQVITSILDNSLRIDFTLNGDTLRITKDYSENNIERIERSITGDTLSYEVSLGFQVRKVEREIEAYGLEDYYYGESKFEDRDTRSDLVLNPRGDTLGYDQYIDGRQNGLEVFGFNDQYGSEEIKFRFLWKNDTVIEILNENILFLKKNMKVVNKEKYLKQNPITSSTSNPLHVSDEKMIRIDADGKTWFVIPFKNNFNYLSNKKRERFYKKLNATLWKQKKLEI